jgi:hypothetical protein
MRLLPVACLAIAGLLLQPNAAPAQSVEITAGYKPSYAELLAMPDGRTLLLLQSDDIDGRKRPSSEALIFDADGTPRSAAPFPAGAVAGARMALLPDGEVALFLPGRVGVDRNTNAQLLLLSPDGVIRHRAGIDRAAAYGNVMLVGPGGSVLVGGGYGDGPYTPWWALYSRSGARLAEGVSPNITPGPGFTSAAFDADGGIRLVGSYFSGPGKFDAVLALYDAAGKPKARHVLLPKGGEVGTATFTSNGIVFIGDNRRSPASIRFYDRDGRPLKEAPWPERERLPSGLIVDGDGMAGMLGDQIIRIDAGGAISWRSPPGAYLGLVRATDGRLRTLSVQHGPGGRFFVQLVSF